MLEDIPPDTPVEDVTYLQVENHLDRVYKEVLTAYENPTKSKEIG
jgi:hypothetical protein